MDERQEADVPAAAPPVPWYLREVTFDRRIFGIGMPMRIFLAIYLPLLFLNAFTWKPLWCLGWRVPFYAMHDFLPVRASSGKWLAGGAWTQSKEIRIYAMPEVAPEKLQHARREMQGLVDELGLDFTVRTMPFPAEAKKSLEASCVVRAGVSYLDFNQFASRRLDDRGQRYAEIFLTYQRFAKPTWAEGMTRFPAGLVVLHPSPRLDRVIVRHEGAHLLGYNKHDDLPYYILGYTETRIPDKRVSLMMLRNATARDLSPRAKDALHYFWVGLEERQHRGYFKR
jgi:hypothetical protein